jgi:hypothetical protein
MQNITLQQALQAIAKQQNNVQITAAQVQALLANASVTFAQVYSVTQVATAAAHKATVIHKVTVANVMLCSNIAAHTSVYARKVKRSAAQYASNNSAAVAAFTATQNYFTHTQCYSIVQHTQHANKQYLYCIYNNARSVYVHNNKLLTKQQVAQYLTKSAAATMLQTDNTVVNKTHNIVHNVTVRTIALSNIIAIKARKHLLHV